MRLILIGGFLGSGKTSLLSAMLDILVDQGRKVLILKNEAGRSQIDVSFLKRPGVDIHNIVGGCACCELRARLVDCLQGLQDGRQFDVILMEPSGVANLLDLRILLFSHLRSTLRVQTVLVLDAIRFSIMLKALPILFFSNMRAAQAVVISKMDLVTPNEMESVRARIFEMDSELPVWSACLNGASGRQAAGELLESAPSFCAWKPDPFVPNRQEDMNSHLAQTFTLHLPESGVEAQQILLLVKRLAEELFSFFGPGHVKLTASNEFGCPVLVTATGPYDASLRGHSGAGLKNPATLTIIMHHRPNADITPVVTRHLAGMLPN